MAPFRGAIPSNPFDYINSQLDEMEQTVKRLKNNRAPTVPFYDSSHWPAQSVEGQLVIAPSIPTNLASLDWELVHSALNFVAYDITDQNNMMGGGAPFGHPGYWDGSSVVSLPYSLPQNTTGSVEFTHGINDSIGYVTNKTGPSAAIDEIDIDNAGNILKQDFSTSGGSQTVRLYRNTTADIIDQIVLASLGSLGVAYVAGGQPGYLYRMPRFNQVGQIAFTRTNYTVVSGSITATKARAAFWNGTTRIDFPDSTYESVAEGVNDSGLVVGTYYDPSHDRAFIWNTNDNTVNYFADALTSDDQYAKGINNAGVVVFGTQASGETFPYAVQSLYIYHKGTFKQLEPLTIGSNQMMWMAGINNHNYVPVTVLDHSGGGGSGAIATGAYINRPVL